MATDKVVSNSEGFLVTAENTDKLALNTDKLALNTKWKQKSSSAPNPAPAPGGK
jgi:hypothetical protein